jgi:hypothetical protein
MPNPANPWPDFRCPVCNGHRAKQVIVKRPNGTEYPTSFYACVICTAMCLNPRSFSEQGKAESKASRGPAREKNDGAGPSSS